MKTIVNFLVEQQSSLFFLSGIIILISIVYYMFRKLHYIKTNVEPIIKEYIQNNSRIENEPLYELKDVKKEIKEYTKGIYLIKINTFILTDNKTKEFTKVLNRLSYSDFYIQFVFINTTGVNQKIRVCVHIDYKKTLLSPTDLILTPDKPCKVSYSISKKVINQLNSGKHNLKIIINDKIFMNEKIYITKDNSNPKNDSEYILKAFSPCKTFDNDTDKETAEKYHHFLDQAIENQNINNIAVTGDLGIGKSSIIKSYEYSRSKRFIYITVADLLCTFENTDKLDGKEIDNIKSNEEQQAEIENSILKQLSTIYSQKEIPASNLPLIPETIKWYDKKVIFSGFFTFAMVVSLFNNYFSNIYANLFIQVINFIFPILLSLLVSYCIYKIYNKFTISKLSFEASPKIEEAKIEISQNESLQRFDRNIFEIIYLLENLLKKGYNILIIEDIDRFPNSICIPVLSKLKQLNVLLNNRIQFKNNLKLSNKTFKFIYVLKDNVFTDIIDPYKFFDITIPIVPTLSSDNVLYLKEFWKDFDLDEKFIEQVSHYLIDYRKIHSVTNEYKIFSTVLLNHKVYKDKNANTMDKTELMAFIIYKIYYPEDYYKLREMDKYGKLKSLLFNYLQSSETAAEQIPFVESLFEVLKSYMSLNILQFIGSSVKSNDLERADKLTNIIKRNDKFNDFKAIEDVYELYLNSKNEAIAYKYIESINHLINSLVFYDDEYANNQMQSILSNIDNLFILCPNEKIIFSSVQSIDLLMKIIINNRIFLLQVKDIDCKIENPTDTDICILNTIKKCYKLCVELDKMSDTNGKKLKIDILLKTLYSIIIFKPNDCLPNAVLFYAQCVVEHISSMDINIDFSIVMDYLYNLYFCIEKYRNHEIIRAVVNTISNIVCDIVTLSLPTIQKNYSEDVGNNLTGAIQTYYNENYSILKRGIPVVHYCFLELLYTIESMTNIPIYKGKASKLITALEEITIYK